MDSGHEGSPSDWRQVVAKKRQLQAAAISAFREFPAQQGGDDVTAISDIQVLAEKLAQRELTSEYVVRTYIAKAIQAHEKTNCLTETLFQDAVARAQDLDAVVAKTGTTVGPLHGIPITVKDQFNTAGFDSTIGYTGRAFKPASTDAILVSILRNLGAVVIAKTNLPQSIMWCETDNPLWGLTTNPMNPNYTPGGSTGGESALLYLRGSMIGWGTDIGGSVRIPSHMMGLYGLKPSSARLPYFGVPVSTEGQEHIHSAVGPMSRDLPSLHHIFKQVMLTEPWTQDSRCAPIPWREEVYNHVLSSKLSIGVLLDDGVIEPHPCVTRVVKSVVELLENDGHTVVPWTTDLHAECIEVMDLYYTADGGEDIRRDIQAGGEPFIPHVERLVNRGKAISVYEYWQLNRRKKALRQAYLDKWNALKSPSTGKPVDILIMPVMPHASVPHGGCRWVGYTKIWNVLDYTAMSVPAGNVEAADCDISMDSTLRNEMDEWTKGLWKQHRQEMAEMKLPIGVQIVGRRLEEEKVLAAAQILDKLLRK